MSAPIPHEQSNLTLHELMQETERMMTPDSIDTVLIDPHRLESHARLVLHRSIFSVMKVRREVGALIRTLASIPKTPSAIANDPAASAHWQAREHDHRIQSLIPSHKLLDYYNNLAVFETIDGSMSPDLFQAQKHFGSILGQWIKKNATRLDSNNNDGLEEITIEKLGAMYAPPIIKMAKAKLLLGESVTTIACMPGLQGLEDHRYSIDEIENEFVDIDPKLLAPCKHTPIEKTLVSKSH